MNVGEMQRKLSRKDAVRPTNGKPDALKGARPVWRGGVRKRAEEQRALLLPYTMRLTVMGQMAKGIATEIKRPEELEENEDVNVDPAAIEKSLERVKWFLWHGNVYRALEVIEDLDCRLESIEGRSEKQRKLLKAVKEFSNYIS